MSDRVPEICQKNTFEASWGKALFIFALKQFLHIWYFQNPKPRFQVSHPSLLTHTNSDNLPLAFWALHDQKPKPNCLAICPWDLLLWTCCCLLYYELYSKCLSLLICSSTLNLMMKLSYKNFFECSKCRLVVLIS